MYSTARMGNNCGERERALGHVLMCINEPVSHVKIKIAGCECIGLYVESSANELSIRDLYWYICAAMKGMNGERLPSLQYHASRNFCLFAFCPSLHALSHTTAQTQTHTSTHSSWSTHNNYEY